VLSAVGSPSSFCTWGNLLRVEILKHVFSHSLSTQNKPLSLSHALHHQLLSLIEKIAYQYPRLGLSHRPAQTLTDEPGTKYGESSSWHLWHNKRRSLSRNKIPSKGWAGMVSAAPPTCTSSESRPGMTQPLRGPRPGQGGKKFWVQPITWDLGLPPSWHLGCFTHKTTASLSPTATLRETPALQNTQ